MITANMVIRTMEMTLLSLTAVILIAALASSGNIHFDYGFEDASVDGSNIRYSFKLDVDNGSVFDIESVQVRATYVDDERGSSIMILNIVETDIHSMSEEHLRYDIKIFAPVLLMMIRDNLSDDGSEFVIRAEASLTYCLGLLDMGLDTDIRLKLAEDGEHIEHVVKKSTDCEYEIAVSGLRDSLRPDDANMLLTDGEKELYIDLCREYESTIVHIGSDEPLTSVLDGFDREKMSMYRDGEKMDIDSGELEMLIDALGYLIGD